MQEVLPADETLQSIQKELLYTKIDFDQKRGKEFFLDEYRTELHDNSINFMGLTEPKQVNYLNFAESSVD